MITLNEYTNGDWDKITDSVEPFTVLGKDFNEIVARGIAVTAVEDGKVMACGGVTFMTDKEATVWVKLSKDCSKRYIMWARTIKETFRLMTESVGDVEVCTYILDKFCKGEKLAKLINMKKTDETAENNGNIYNKYSVVL